MSRFVRSEGAFRGERGLLFGLEGSRRQEKDSAVASSGEEVSVFETLERGHAETELVLLGADSSESARWIAERTGCRKDALSEPRERRTCKTSLSNYLI